MVRGIIGVWKSISSEAGDTFESTGRGKAVTTTILVVENDTIVRTAVRRYLKSQGHRVVEAANGIEALAQLKVQTVDLVLTDVNMPGMHGVELIRRLRQEEPKMPIVVMTGLPERVDLLEHELGLQCVLTKPFELEDLSNAVRQALG